jgi:alkanesulfonate monooxygenase SsuD/methylene tetrahydromethanopterin reductase-like flavin-dependent oxidoreductase (luciferase family)
VHPLFAAKQGATIDHITDGRFALNVVCGWVKPELEMFGAPIMEHEVRYEYAAEWLEIVKMLWTREDEFDFEGKYFKINKGFSMPKPLQRPTPPIMNAGGSGTGQRFAAKYADMAFILVQQHDPEGTKRQIDAYRDLARREFGREIQIWCSAYVVHGDTQKEAEDYLRYYVVDRGDDVAVANLTNIMMANAQTLPDELMEQFKFHFKAGWGGFPLVGTADRIASELESLSSLGLDGVVLSWVDYRYGLDTWRRDVMPRLEQAGLRRPLRASVPA